MRLVYYWGISYKYEAGMRRVGCIAAMRGGELLMPAGLLSPMEEDAARKYLTRLGKQTGKTSWMPRVRDECRKAGLSTRTAMRNHLPQASI